LAQLVGFHLLLDLQKERKIDCQPAAAPNSAGIKVVPEPTLNNKRFGK